MNNIESSTGEIVMYQPDETIRLEVRVENDSVWLTQQQMADLFLTTKQNVSLHINNIFNEDELVKNSVVKESLTTAKDETTLTMLSKRDANVSATIYTSKLSQNLRQLKLDIERHNQQYPPIDINICQRNHDRFLIIDDVVYLFGASLKDAGKKLFAYIKMQETPAAELLNNIN